MIMHEWIRLRRHYVAFTIILMTIGYFTLAVTDPEAATPIGVGYIAVVLTFTALSRWSANG